MTEIQCSTQSEVLSAVAAGLPWRRTVVFVGITAKGNTSQKFWSMSGVGSGPVAIRWGRLGNKAQTKKTPTPLHAALGKMGEKLGKGYVPANPGLSQACAQA